MSTFPAELHVEHYVAYMNVLAHSLVGSQLRARVDASDVVQQALLEAHATRQQFRGSCAGEFKNWLKKILRHTVVNMSRYNTAGIRDIRNECALDLLINRSARRLELLSRDPSPSDGLQREESEQSLSKAINQLPCEQRQAVILVRLQELTCEDAARQMDVDVKSVVNLLRCGMRSLREHMIPEARHG